MAVEKHAHTPEPRAEADGNQSPPLNPSHHPPAPYDELFDVSTTIDPAYIISSIRKLLPVDFKDRHGCDERNGVEETDGDGMNVDTSRDCSRLNGNKAGLEVWEESGCMLWDLSATRTHAEFMVQNLVLEVLLANLTVATTDRVKEICLGIIGNLSYHDLPRRQIINTSGLVEVIADQLYSDDTPCLCEVCRVITLGLQSSGCVTWAEALQSENILARLLWIIENALNPQLIERSAQLLLTILESSEIVSFFLPPLVKLGLPNLLIKLLNFEMNILIHERVPERYCVLEIILSSIESLSVNDEYSREISSSKELFQLLCSLVKFTDKFEVANCCVAAAVLIANILSETIDWVLELSTDLSFIQGLFEIFPFASDDGEANSALWAVLARVLVKVEESKMTLTALHQYVSLLVSNTDRIEDSLLDSQSVASPTHMENRLQPTAKTIALSRIIAILNCWTAARDEKPNAGEEIDDGNKTVETNFLDTENIVRLIECCYKYVEK